MQQKTDASLKSEMRAVLWSVGFVLIRLGLAIRFFVPFTWASALFGVSELSALALTVRGLMCGKVDDSKSGLLLPVLYCLPLLLRQSGTPTAWAFPFMVASFCQIGFRVMMLGRLSVGVPVFVALLDKGVYAIVRHPLYLVELAQAALFVATFPTVWNAACVAVVVPGIVAGVLLEEKFLFTVPAYQAYARKVRWRLLWGVF